MKENWWVSSSMYGQFKGKSKKRDTEKSRGKSNNRGKPVRVSAGGAIVHQSTITVTRLPPYASQFISPSRRLNWPLSSHVGQKRSL